MKLFKLFTICAAVASSALFAEEAVENVFISQDFENPAFFEKVSPSGYTARNAQTGQWGLFKAEKVVSITNEQAASGEYCLKYIAKKPTPYFAFVVLPTPLSDSFEFEFYMNTPQKARFTVGLVTETNGKKERNLSFGSFDNNNNLAYLDFKAGKWKRSGIKFPFDEWVLCKMKYDKAAKNISYYVVLNDKEEKVGEINLDAPIEKVVFVEFRHNISPDGSVLYVDDVKIVKK